MHKPVRSLLDEHHAVVDEFEPGKGIHDLVVVLDVDLEGVVVVGEMDEVGAAVEGTKALEGTEFVVVQEDYLQLGEAGHCILFGEPGDVVI